MTTRRILTTVLMAGAILASIPASNAHAGEKFGLQLGRGRLTADGKVAVPVKLRVPQGQEVAALNFTVRWDPGHASIASAPVIAGRAVSRARAELASRSDDAAGTLRAIVVPEFSGDFASLRGRRIATVLLDLRGPAPHNVGRWVRRNVSLEDVVLGDPEGREIRFRDSGERS